MKGVIAGTADHGSRGKRMTLICISSSFSDTFTFHSVTESTDECMSDMLQRSLFTSPGFKVLWGVSLSWVCVSVCLSARISLEPHSPSLPNQIFLCMLPVTVAWSSFDILTIGRIADCREGVVFPMDNPYISRMVPQQAKCTKNLVKIPCGSDARSLPNLYACCLCLWLSPPPTYLR